MSRQVRYFQNLASFKEVEQVLDQEAGETWAGRAVLERGPDGLVRGSVEVNVPEVGR